MQDGALEAIKSFGQKPSAVINSGNGIQILWRLDEPLVPATEVEAERGVAIGLRRRRRGKGLLAPIPHSRDQKPSDQKEAIEGPRHLPHQLMGGTARHTRRKTFPQHAEIGGSAPCMQLTVIAV